MAAKKVYFYKMILCDKDEKELDVGELRTHLTEIIKHNGYKNGDYMSLDVSPLTEYLHFVLDVFEYENNRMFCRLSKQKPNSSVIQRDYSTYKKQDVLPSGIEHKKGIEQYTFGILEYETGIFSIVSSKSAPGIEALKNLFERYMCQYKLGYVPIPNENAIDMIYFGNEPEVSQIEVEIPLPSAATLEHVFGWKEDEYLQVLANRNLRLGVTVKGQPRSSIIYGNYESQNIIEKIRENILRYKKAKIKGKVKNEKMREYNFFDENFSYPIDIADYRMKEYERIYYTVDELVEIYKQNLVNAYNENEEILKTIANR